MKSILAFLLGCIAHTCLAQHRIHGTVTENEKQTPVAGAYVYINNSTIRTSTNSEGKYVLRLPAAGKYAIVIAAMGHELASFETEADGEVRKDVVLNPKTVEIAEVTVSAYQKDGWKQWGTYFTESFIGTSAFAKQTKILNHEVLRFRYSATDKVLQVFAMAPLKISNRALGYEITYALNAYQMDFNTRHLYYDGYAYFKESKRISSNVRRNREDAFASSLMRFTRSTYSKSWEKDGYTVRELVRVVDNERMRIDSLMKKINQRVFKDLQGNWTAFYRAQDEFNADSIQYFRAMLRKPKEYSLLKSKLNESQIMTAESTAATKAIQYENYLHVKFSGATYEKSYFDWNSEADGASLIKLSPHATVYIDALGNFSPAINWTHEGYWAWYNKICTMLPLDYQSDSKP